MLQSVAPAHSNPLSTNPITRSLRFRASASTYLSRTNSSSVTNSSVWTWSGWVKIGYWSPGNAATLMGNGVNGGANESSIKFTNNQLEVINYVSSTVQTRRVTTQVFRDPSAWYHIIVASNSSTALNIYVNGVQVTSFGTSNGPSAAAWALNTASQSTGIGFLTSAQNFDGYMAEVNFIDGQALTPSSFGSTNALTGVWQPIRYAGTYGLNGFYLPFTNTTSTTTLGYDSSGNGNNWTPNNFSLTAGVTYDSMTDVPTLTSATAANYCVANAVNKPTNSTITNGNLTVDGGASAQYSFAQSTFNLPSGLFYFEATLSTATATSNGLGLLLPTISKDITTYSTSGVYAINWGNSGQISTYTNGGTAVTISTTNWVNGDIIQVAYNATNGNIWFGRNGTYYPATNGGTVGSPAANTNPTVVGVAGLTPTAINYGNGTKWDLNFGQRPFTYTPPSGFKALNAFNLPDPTIPKGNKFMDATLWTGNGTSQSIVNAAAFRPDLVWIKSRSNVLNNMLYTSLQGTGRGLVSNSTAAEFSDADSLQSYTSNGFTVGQSSHVNTNAATYVGWQWQAGANTSSTNTNGTITSTVSVNASAGFSIVTYTGTGANATIGHGLGVAPSMVIFKRRNTSANWVVYHSSVGNTAALFLDSTVASSASSVYFNNTSPTSSVFSVGTAVGVNNTSDTYVAYCFAQIAGYSAFGRYTGNGSTDGPFIYTNFQPKFVLIKASSTTSQWVLWDAARNTYNVTNSILYPNLTSAEYSFSIDILSNGFKFRESGGAGNDSGVTYIYAAFASNPFKYSNAR